MIQLVSINVGKPQALKVNQTTVQSGIYKNPIDADAYLSYTQLEGDGQADLKNHGGPDKALCAYASDHFEFWTKRLGISVGPTFFGENLTLIGLTEEKACVGDTYRFGETVIQVSQPRGPCYKIAAKSGIKDLAEQVRKTGLTGFYFRVLEEGIISPNSGLEKLESDPRQVSVAAINAEYYAENPDYIFLEQLLSLEPLSSSWKRDIQKRIMEP